MTHPKARLAGSIALSFAAFAWMSAVAAGLHRLMAYETTAGPSGSIPASWPTGTSLPRIAGVPNLLMAVHPKCPCTRASLATLAAILRRSPAGPSTRLLVYRPVVADAGWGDSPSDALSGAAGMELVDDPGGLEAARFGLATSGASVAFDAEGTRRFAGGLNSTRGGEEMSGGGRSLLSVLGGEEARIAEAEVYGCPIGTTKPRGSPEGRR